MAAALSFFPAEINTPDLIRKGRDYRRLSDSGKAQLVKAGVNADQLFKAAQIIQIRVAAATEARESQKRQLISALQSGELLALGYPGDRPRAEAPEHVPQSLIQLEFANFRESEFAAGEISYGRVRVVPGDALPQRIIGRPTPRDAILEIASILADTGAIDPSMKKTAQAAKIHKYGTLNSYPKFTEKHPHAQTIIRQLDGFWGTFKKQ